MHVYFLVLFFLPFLFSCSNKPQLQGLYTNKFHQASLASGEWQKEEFMLDEKKSLVDILIVADTSESMYHHLSNLGRSLSDLLLVISHYNWQIGITSADHGDHEDPLGLQQSWRDHIGEAQGKFGGLMNLENGEEILKAKILTAKTKDYEDVFFHTLSHEPDRDCYRPPYCHPRLEQPLRSLMAAMKRALLDNGPFFRPQADFVSLIITNEEERAEDRERATKASQVVETFDKIFGHLDKKLIAFNILIKDEKDKKCLTTEKEKSEVAHIGKSIAELADLTGGNNISICNKNYGKELKIISEHIKNSLENSILLKKEPIPETVSLEFIEGPELNWKLYGRKIVFENRYSSPVYVSVSYQNRREN